MGKSKLIRVGTRGPPLALRQTEMARAALKAAWPDIETEVVVIKTSGDWTPAQGEARLIETQGGKGLFAKEIEQALLEGRIDAGIHSMKDMDSHLPSGLIIDHMLPREDARDVIIFNNLANNVQKLKDISQGATIGTCSVRRQAFLLSKRPDFKIVPLRGNVQTRLDKLHDSKEMNGIVLAKAGLKRLGLEVKGAFDVGIDEMLPSAGQGAVGIEIRAADEHLITIFSHINHFDTVICVKAERAALANLDGSCHTPIGAHATYENSALKLRLGIASLDGRESFYEEDLANIADIQTAEKFGIALAEKLKASIPPETLNCIMS